MNAHTDLSEQRDGDGVGADGGWRRLHPRILWVDALQSLLSLLPAVLAVWVFGVEATLGNLWPFLLLAIIGVYGAASDIVRWTFTWYRITGSHIELRTGVLWREHRSVQRDRIRRVDTEARLWHRITGLRVVSVGAGQQAVEGESAFELDAVSPQEAERLQTVLLQDTAVVEQDTDRGSEQSSEGDTAGAASANAGTDGDDDRDSEYPQVFAVFHLKWIIHNIFNIWSVLLALGMTWGGLWILETFGIDVVTPVITFVDTWDLSVWQIVLFAMVAIWVIGTVGLAAYYVLDFWNFELARVRGARGTLLRTRQGLLRTREVNRDDDRMRGVEIGEPLLWQWMGTTSTRVITTGLDEEDDDEPTAILPRCPARVAGPVAARALDGPDPRTVQLRPHPRAALVPRLWRATLFTALATGALAVAMVAFDPLTATVLWIGASLWPVTLVLAVVAYRALGHTVTGRHLVVRSGLAHRNTTVLKRAAVSTIAVRESIPQRLLGLRTVEAMTSAGKGGYSALDMKADEATGFADEAAPGVLEPFLVRDSAPAAEGAPAEGAPSSC